MTAETLRRPIDAVFSQTVATSIGSGVTARKVSKLLYFHAKERADGVIEVQQILEDDQPFGPVKELSLDALLEQFILDPQRSLDLARKQASCDDAVNKAVARGDKFLHHGKTYSAEYEYGKALNLDVDNVRANFGIGQCYIARGDSEKAKEVFRRLVKLDATFAPEHKHLFNAFGISLRKSALHPEALAYYARAVELSPEDENLQYNMARAAHDMGDLDLAARHLERCLALNPKHEEGLQFAGYLRRKRAKRK